MPAENIFVMGPSMKNAEHLQKGKLSRDMKKEYESV